MEVRRLNSANDQMQKLPPPPPPHLILDQMNLSLSEHSTSNTGPSRNLACSAQQACGGGIACRTNRVPSLHHNFVIGGKPCKNHIQSLLDINLPMNSNESLRNLRQTTHQGSLGSPCTNNELNQSFVMNDNRTSCERHIPACTLDQNMNAPAYYQGENTSMVAYETVIFQKRVTTTLGRQGFRSSISNHPSACKQRDVAGNYNGSAVNNHPHMWNQRNDFQTCGNTNRGLGMSVQQVITSCQSQNTNQEVSGNYNTQIDQGSLNSALPAVNHPRLNPSQAVKYPYSFNSYLPNNPQIYSHNTNASHCDAQYPSTELVAIDKTDILSKNHLPSETDVPCTLSKQFCGVESGENATDIIKIVDIDAQDTGKAVCKKKIKSRKKDTRKAENGPLPGMSASPSSDMLRKDVKKSTSKSRTAKKSPESSKPTKKISKKLENERENCSKISLKKATPKTKSTRGNGSKLKETKKKSVQNNMGSDLVISCKRGRKRKQEQDVKTTAKKLRVSKQPTDETVDVSQVISDPWDKIASCIEKENLIGKSKLTSTKVAKASSVKRKSKPCKTAINDKTSNMTTASNESKVKSERYSTTSIKNGEKNTKILLPIPSLPTNTSCPTKSKCIDSSPKKGSTGMSHLNKDSNGEIDSTVHLSCSDKNTSLKVHDNPAVLDIQMIKQQTGSVMHNKPQEENIEQTADHRLEIQETGKPESKQVQSSAVIAKSKVHDYFSVAGNLPVMQKEFTGKVEAAKYRQENMCIEREREKDNKAASSCKETDSPHAEINSDLSSMTRLQETTGQDVDSLSVIEKLFSDIEAVLGKPCVDQNEKSESEMQMNYCTQEKHSGSELRPIENVILNDHVTDSANENVETSEAIINEMLSDVNCVLGKAKHSEYFVPDTKSQGEMSADEKLDTDIADDKNRDHSINNIDDFDDSLSVEKFDMKSDFLSELDVFDYLDDDLPYHPIALPLGCHVCSDTESADEGSGDEHGQLTRLMAKMGQEKYQLYQEREVSYRQWVLHKIDFNDKNSNVNSKSSQGEVSFTDSITNDNMDTQHDLKGKVLMDHGYCLNSSTEKNKTFHETSVTATCSFDSSSDCEASENLEIGYKESETERSPSKTLSFKNVDNQNNGGKLQELTSVDMNKAGQGKSMVAIREIVYDAEVRNGEDQVGVFTVSNVPTEQANCVTINEMEGCKIEFEIENVQTHFNDVFQQDKTESILSKGPTALQVDKNCTDTNTGSTICAHDQNFIQWEEELNLVPCSGDNTFEDSVKVLQSTNTSLLDPAYLMNSSHDNHGSANEEKDLQSIATSLHNPMNLLNNGNNNHGSVNEVKDLQSTATSLHNPVNLLNNGHDNHGSVNEVKDLQSTATSLHNPVNLLNNGHDNHGSVNEVKDLQSTATSLHNPVNLLNNGHDINGSANEVKDLQSTATSLHNPVNLLNNGHDNHGSVNEVKDLQSTATSLHNSMNLLNNGHNNHGSVNEVKDLQSTATSLHNPVNLLNNGHDNHGSVNEVKDLQSTATSLHNHVNLMNNVHDNIASLNEVKDLQSTDTSLHKPVNLLNNVHDNSASLEEVKNLKHTAASLHNPVNLLNNGKGNPLSRIADILSKTMQCMKERKSVLLKKTDQKMSVQTDELNHLDFMKANSIHTPKLDSVSKVRDSDVPKNGESYSDKNDSIMTDNDTSYVLEVTSCNETNTTSEFHSSDSFSLEQLTHSGISSDENVPALLPAVPSNEQLFDDSRSGDNILVSKTHSKSSNDSGLIIEAAHFLGENFDPSKRRRKSKNNYYGKRKRRRKNSNSTSSEDLPSDEGNKLSTSTKRLKEKQIHVDLNHVESKVVDERYALPELSENKVCTRNMQKKMNTSGNSDTEPHLETMDENMLSGIVKKRKVGRPPSVSKDQDRLHTGVSKTLQSFQTRCSGEIRQCQVDLTRVYGSTEMNKTNTNFKQICGQTTPEKLSNISTPSKTTKNKKVGTPVHKKNSPLLKKQKLTTVLDLTKEASSQCQMSDYANNKQCLSCIDSATDVNKKKKTSRSKQQINCTDFSEQQIEIDFSNLKSNKRLSSTPKKSKVTSCDCYKEDNGSKNTKDTKKTSKDDKKKKISKTVPCVERAEVTPAAFMKKKGNCNEKAILNVNEIQNKNKILKIKSSPQKNSCKKKTTSPCSQTTRKDKKKPVKSKNPVEASVEPAKKCKGGMPCFRLVTDREEQKIVKSKNKRIKSCKKTKTCKFCEKEFDNRQQIRDHMHQSHPFRCSNCSTFFSTREERTQHKFKFHTPEVYHCGSCDRRFANLSHLETHGKSSIHGQHRDIIRSKVGMIRSFLDKIIKICKEQYYISHGQVNCPSLPSSPSDTGRQAIMSINESLFTTPDSVVSLAPVPSPFVSFLTSEQEDNRNSTIMQHEEPELRQLVRDMEMLYKHMSRCYPVSNTEAHQDQQVTCATYVRSLQSNGTDMMPLENGANNTRNCITAMDQSIQRSNCNNSLVWDQHEEYSHGQMGYLGQQMSRSPYQPMHQPANCDNNFSNVSRCTQSDYMALDQFGQKPTNSCSVQQGHCQQPKNNMLGTEFQRGLSTQSIISCQNRMDSTCKRQSDRSFSRLDATSDMCLSSASLSSFDNRTQNPAIDCQNSCGNNYAPPLRPCGNQHATNSRYDLDNCDWLSRVIDDVQRHPPETFNDLMMTNQVGKMLVDLDKATYSTSGTIPSFTRPDSSPIFTNLENVTRTVDQPQNLLEMRGRTSSSLGVLGGEEKVAQGNLYDLHNYEANQTGSSSQSKYSCTRDTVMSSPYDTQPSSSSVISSSSNSQHLPDVLTAAEGLISMSRANSHSHIPQNTSIEAPADNLSDTALSSPHVSFEFEAVKNSNDVNRGLHDQCSRSEQNTPNKPTCLNTESHKAHCLSVDGTDQTFNAGQEVFHNYERTDPISSSDTSRHLYSSATSGHMPDPHCGVGTEGHNSQIECNQTVVDTCDKDLSESLSSVSHQDTSILQEELAMILDDIRNDVENSGNF